MINNCGAVDEKIIGRGNRSIRGGGTCPNTILITKSFTWPDLGSNPSRRRSLTSWAIATGFVIHSRKYRFYWMKQKLWKFSRFRLLWSHVATSSTTQMKPSQRTVAPFLWGAALLSKQVATHLTLFLASFLLCLRREIGRQWVCNLNHYHRHSGMASKVKIESDMTQSFVTFIFFCDSPSVHTQ
jgi:hypothetical protein